MFRNHHAVGALLLFVVVPAAILSGSCTVHKVEPQCIDGIKNKDETDVDCGGPHCDSCEEKKACVQQSDCASGVCAGQVCSTSSCTDGASNGSETDIDCGGMCTLKCADDKTCGVGSDCASTFCNKGVCVARCNNATTDDDETDTDCGGSCTEKCADGKTCKAGSDCASTFCVTGVCVVQCKNTAKDGDETDKDCGGSCPTKCSVGRDCKVKEDCFSDACTGNLCVPGPASVGCFDIEKNNQETDINCGGGACTACKLGESCLLDRDCLKSLKCDLTMDKCQAP